MVSGDPSKRYRRYAAECIRLAQLSRDQKEKNVLLQMAETWQRLADEAETKQTGPRKD